MIYRYRSRVPTRDRPADFGPWQTVWKRHRRFAADGTWDAVLTALLSLADADDVIDWSAVAVDSTSCRVHQHGASLARDQGAALNYPNLCDENPPITPWVARAAG